MKQWGTMVCSVWASTGKWSGGKGLDDLLTAWKAAEERGSNVELLLAAGGPDLWTRTDGAENRPLAEGVGDLAEILNIRTPGKLPREEMPEFWRLLDVAVVGFSARGG